jgi:cell wall-associated NlpC family hydrolase
LRAGDLVFMHLKHKELHVGIALDNVRFIHAPSSGGRVRIDSLAAAPYAQGFIDARRVIE